MSTEIANLRRLIMAGNEIISHLDGVYKSIESARHWSDGDKGERAFLLLKSADDHEQIARDKFLRVIILLRNFENELAEIELDLNIEIKEILDEGSIGILSDIFFGGISVDWNIHKRISNAMRYICKTKNRINMVLEALRKRIESIGGIHDLSV